MIKEEPTNEEFINVNGITYVPYEMFKHEHDFAQVTLNRLNELERKPKDILDKIIAEIEENAYPIVHGVNNHELGMTLYGILQVIDKYKADNKYEAKVITRGNCMMCGKELTEGLFFCKECKDKGK